MRHLFLLAPAALLIACSSGGEGDLGEAAEAALTANALTANALTANALVPGALSAAGLGGSVLNPSKLTPTVATAIKDPGPAGDLSRKLVRYAVSCALDAAATFAFSWTDGGGVVHQESYPGGLGLATVWAQKPIGADVPSQEWVSACLAARTNWYGITVTLSARGAAAPLATPDPAEVAAYGMEEGAFWGNLFTATPALAACHVPADDDNSHARYRDCASGHHNDDGTVSACGIIQLSGACSAVCAPLTGGIYHPSCAGSGRAVTVFLP